jgi:hypothetical protein
MTWRWPQSIGKLIEDEANGPAVMQMLERGIPGLVPVEPKGGKEMRANGVAPVCRSSNMWLPHPALHPWVNAYLDEAESFLVSTESDQVDATTQYLLRRYGGGSSVAQILAAWRARVGCISSRRNFRCVPEQEPDSVGAMPPASARLHPECLWCRGCCDMPFVVFCANVDLRVCYMAEIPILFLVPRRQRGRR